MRIAYCVAPIVVTCVLSGCGPEYATVTGRVTLDGEPLPNATVSFMPEDEGGHPSFGRTEADGSYSLQETHRLDGALPGKYTVRITTYVEGNPDVAPPIPTVPERVPAKYNIETVLTEEVKPGENVLDFPLDSNGKIVQPTNTYR
jgi:hypothetical protein